MEYSLTMGVLDRLLHHLLDAENTRVLAAALPPPILVEIPGAQDVAREPSSKVRDVILMSLFSGLHAWASTGATRWRPAGVPSPSSRIVINRRCHLPSQGSSYSSG